MNITKDELLEAMLTIRELLQEGNALEALEEVEAVLEQADLPPAVEQ